MTASAGSDPVSPGDAFAATELVEVAPAAIVSRVVMKTAGGSVTLFAFAAGQELSEHTAPFDALVHVVAGQLELVVGGKPISAGAGDLVLMPARVPHAVRAVEDSTMMLTMLRDREERLDAGS